MPEENRSGLSRREFIKKSLGTLGLMTALSSPLVLLNRVRATSEAPETFGASENTTGRAWSMVIDLKRCDACVSLGVPPQCTQACIAGHYVPKGQQWIEVFHAELPGGGTFFMPAPCYHCENAPCVNVCPVAATYHTEEGVVLIDQRRCIGCRFCMAACPYHRRFFNWGTPELPPEAYEVRYTPERQVPAIKGTVMKCDFCPDMMHVGQLPFCVTACPHRALYMADLRSDLASNGIEVARMSFLLDRGDAFRYKEDLGTQPRVYYLPGHGQEVGRLPDDPRQRLPSEWTWGGEGYDRTVKVFPWGEGGK